MNRHTNWPKKRKNSLRECMRRLRQIRAGKLSGRCGPRLRSPFVSDEAWATVHRMVM